MAGQDPSSPLRLSYDSDPKDPYSQGFIGRVYEINIIRQALQSPRQHPGQKRFVITGKSGQGKTALCVQVVEDVRRSLESSNDAWLLILDNANDPNSTYTEYFPQCQHGSIIIISRETSVHRQATMEPLFLRGMSPADSVLLLQRTIDWSVPPESEEAHAAEEAALLLENHALSLILANAFITKHRCSFASYVKKYEAEKTQALCRLQDFLEDESIAEKPEKNKNIIEETKLEVSLLSTNSPYPEVRAVVDNHDDPGMPCSTIRAWIIGLSFVVLLAFVNQLFSVRQPSIFLEAPVVQLLSFPVGKAAAKYLPDVGFTLFGSRHSLNPGPFNKKEHMLISIMASVGKTLPSSRYIIFTQFLDTYFGQKYAGSFGYQILLALSTDFMEENHAVPGPLKRLYNVSRFRLFLYAFGAMFVWFWFPDYIFAALSLFNWLAWIAPNNFHLTAITGLKKGLGFNPIPTFDWNVATHLLDPLVVPFAVTLNTFFGCLLGGFVLIGMYYTNALHTGYLPINTNSMFNHYAKSYNVSAVLDDRGWLDEEKYQAYSQVYLAASSLTMYWFSFAVYTATISYSILYHRRDIVNGFQSLFRGYGKTTEEFKDVHTRLMSVYREVPEWWYLCLNIFAIVLGTTVGVVFFGIALALVFVIPTGIIYATTGLQVEYNYIAEFIGGAWLPGNALAMNFFKCYGYVTTAHALAFSNDLKLAHYVKIPPRTTFWAQAAATLVSAFVCTGVMNFQMRNIHDICESDQKDKFTCPGVNTYFTAAVLFGSMGARKVFGAHGQYTVLLSAFPVGAAIPFAFYLLQRRLPRTHWFRRAHPIPLLNGGTAWSPYNIAYVWPAVLPGWLSMAYLRTRHLAFWAKYNYVVSAAFSTAIAVAAVVIFFAVEYNGYAVEWWGNGAESGCESKACTRLKLPAGEYFGPRVGGFS
ncbi:hypothetical protein SLS54_008041 [Diplodia seriata]